MCWLGDYIHNVVYISRQEQCSLGIYSKEGWLRRQSKHIHMRVNFSKEAHEVAVGFDSRCRHRGVIGGRSFKESLGALKV